MSGRGIIIRAPFVDWILDGKKTWELRSRRASVRGPIALIEGGTGTVVGTCELVDCLGPLTRDEFLAGAEHINAARAVLAADRWEPDDPPVYAWVLAKARRLPKPVPYEHPRGAVIWVTLDDDVCRRIGLG